MALIVQKFGGTSVADIERIKKVGQIILREQQAGHNLVVVVSAMAGVTNSLISKCKEISELNSYNHMKEYDAVVGSGEIVTCGLLALELSRLGLKAQGLQGWQIPILTDNTFGSAQVASIDSDFLHELINKGIIPVITGFQGVTSDKEITTLGKGGSDTTAALIAAAIKADRADIYTDVIGVFTADPRVVHEAAKINCVSAEIMVELGGAGAKVLHPRAALAAYRYKFEMRILSSFEDDSGTLITDIYPFQCASQKLGSSKNEKNMENRIITAITSNKNLLQIEIIVSGNGFAEIIKKFADEGAVVEKVEIKSKSINLIANLTDKNKFEVILQTLKNSGNILTYNINSNISTVTMVGYGIKNDNGFCFEIMELLATHQIQIKSLEATEVRFTAFLEDQDTEKAIKLLHKEFIK